MQYVSHMLDIPVASSLILQPDEMKVEILKVEINADFIFPLYNSCVDMTEKSKAVMQQGTVLKKQEKIIINVIHPSWGVILSVLLQK